MPPFFSTVIAVFAALFFEEWYAESALPAGDVLTQLPALFLWLAPVAAAEGLFRYTSWRFRVGKPFEPRRYAIVIAQLPLPLYFVALFAFRWPEILVPLGLEGVVFVDICVVLLPFAALLVATLFEVERLKRPLHVTAAGIGPMAREAVRPVVVEQLRQIALPLAPMLVLLALFDLVQDTRLNTWFDYLPLLSAVAILALFAALLAAFPLFAKWALGMKPMQADSPLRRQLEAFAARIGFSCRDFLYWRTRRPTLNAALLGVWSRYRYVIFTEDLLRRLTLDEITNVFAHEAGHGTRHHARYTILYTGVFAALLLPVSSALGAWMEKTSGGSYDAGFAATVFIQIPAFVLFWTVCFSPLSRRFELEADVEGVRSSGDAKRFMETLEKVGRVARVERTVRGKRHFSIEGRSEFLTRVFIDGETALLERFETALLRTRKWITAASIAALLGVIAWTGLDSIAGYSAIALERGDAALARSLLDRSAWWSGQQPRAIALRIEAERYDAAVQSDALARLLAGASRWLESETRVALVECRSGWARAIVNRRPDVALTLVEIAEALNAVPATTPGATPSRRLVDADAKADLRDMREVAELLTQSDKAALRAFLSTAPRWLRRPDAKAAVASLETWARDDSKSVSEKELH